jgi:hypothetical protein
MCHSPFSHVDFVLPPNFDNPIYKRYLGYDPLPNWAGMLLGASSMGDGTPCIAGNPNGVAIRPLDYEEFGYRRQMILNTPLADAIYARFLTQLGKPFDNGALKDFLSSNFPGVRDWRDLGLWFCAEGCVWGMEYEGLYGDEGLNWPKNRVSPTDLLLLHANDPNWTNKKVFWEPIPGLQMAHWEK